MNESHSTAEGDEIFNWLDRYDLPDVVLVLDLAKLDVDVEALHHHAHLANDILDV
jgi:hypothetical protein